MNSFYEANIIFTISVIMLVKKINETNWSCPFLEEWTGLGGAEALGRPLWLSSTAHTSSTSHLLVQFTGCPQVSGFASLL